MNEFKKVLDEALAQVTDGKGKERHGNGLPFSEQPMMMIAKSRGIGFMLGQADKKTLEAQGMLERGQIEAFEQEILGAINYLAGSIVFIRETNKISAAQLIKRAADHGMVLSARGDLINIRAKSRPSDEMLDQLKAHKAEILAELDPKQKLSEIWDGIEWPNVTPCWRAIDKNGTGCFFFLEPKACGDQWVTKTGLGCSLALNVGRDYLDSKGINWKETLEQKP